jgi:hypothetical protein
MGFVGRYKTDGKGDAAQDLLGSGFGVTVDEGCGPLPSGGGCDARRDSANHFKKVLVKLFGGMEMVVQWAWQGRRSILFGTKNS